MSKKRHRDDRAALLALAGLTALVYVAAALLVCLVYAAASGWPAGF